jgi:hypothetical protein
MCVPYGHLFDDATVLELDSDSLAILATVSALDWSSIEPAILGTLFERSLDAAKRSQLGMHYTSKDDILLAQSSMVSAAPSSLPNCAGRATLATSASASPGRPGHKLRPLHLLAL